MTGIEKKKYAELLVACTPEGGEPDEDRAQLEFVRWKCLTDLYYLGTEVLSLGKKKGKVYPQFHRWLCHVLSMEGDKMILVPRKHAKTTWMKVQIVQDILIAGGMIRIMLLSKTGLISELNLKSIKRFLATPLLRRLFPEIIPDPGKDYKNWAKSTQSELTMRDNPESVSNEPQIIALGSAASFTGTAVDKIYMDDYIDNDTVRTAGMMQKSEEEWGYIQPILDEGGTICVTGTFYHYNDLYNKIIKEGHFEKERIFVRRAVENGKIIYPTQFTHAKLDRLRKIMGPYLYSCQYDLNPTPREDQIFPGPQPTCSTLPADKYRYFITVDPAATTEGYSDQTGFCVAAMNKNSNLFIIEAFGAKWKGPEKADWIIKKCVQYRPEKVGVEFGLQADLEYTIRSRVSEYEQATKTKVFLNLVPIKTSRALSKGERINRTLGSFVRMNKVMILESCRELVLEMDTFTGKGNEKDNVIDAASMVFPLIGSFSYLAAGLKEMVQPGSFMDLFRKNKGTFVWQDQFNGFGKRRVS